jgi:sugar O-acyltransferase (sialic acid O-acetyltransferase NeuD family)
MNKKKLIIFGTGETAYIALKYFQKDSNYNVIALTADDEFLDSGYNFSIPKVSFSDCLKKFSNTEYFFFIAISSGKLNHIRTEKYNFIKSAGYRLASYVSSFSQIHDVKKIGENCFILENNTIQPNVTIGNNVTIWSGNHIGHSSVIEDNCFISSHCVISGFCRIGSYSFLGVNSTIENNTIIEKNNFIGASSLIRKNTNEGDVFQINETKKSNVSSKKLFKY